MQQMEMMEMSTKNPVQNSNKVWEIKMKIA